MVPCLEVLFPEDTELSLLGLPAVSCLANCSLLSLSMVLTFFLGCKLSECPQWPFVS